MFHHGLNVYPKSIIWNLFHNDHEVDLDPTSESEDGGVTLEATICLIHDWAESCAGNNTASGSEGAETDATDPDDYDPISNSADETIVVASAEEYDPGFSAERPAKQTTALTANDGDPVIAACYEPVNKNDQANKIARCDRGSLVTFTAVGL